MIRPGELRINSILLHGYTIVYVKAIFPAHFICETEEGISRGNSLQSNFCPIPLSPEILEKLGFVGKYKSCGYNYSKKGFKISSQDEDDFGNPIENYVFHVYHNYQGQPLYYVHQIQNAYFIFTGEELIFKQ